MRRLPSLNLLLIAVAALGALALTFVRRSPDSVVGYTVEQQQSRAAPGTHGADKKYDLSALTIFNLTQLRIKENYVDPDRVDPKKMLYQALDSVQFNIPEVLVEEHEDKDSLEVVVNDKHETYSTSDVDSPWRLSKKLSKIFRFIQANMNDGADLAEVEYAAVNGMLATLDPHSELMDPEAAREMDVTTSGKFGGLGIVIRMIDKKLTVVRPMKDTPADKKGMKAGDVITKIDSEPTANLTLNEAVDRMRGDPGTPVTLWVSRKGETKDIRFDLTRDIIRVESVVYKMLDQSVGYIKIKQFSSSTGAEVESAMNDLESQGAVGWVLDLRGNPGGLLEQAIAVADLFVDAGTIVTTVSGRERDPRRAQKGGDTKSPLAVLVNGGSASASEIVSGALKNLDRGVIIGTRTFGKGSVQVLYDNDDGSKLKLTVAEYLTPGDRSIQNLGIVPDIQLQRMYVPDKNDAVGDWVRLLPPSHSWSESQYDVKLVSQYAHDTDKPTYQLPYLYEDPEKAKKAAEVDGTDDETGPADPADEDASDDTLAADEIPEDYEMKVARQLVAASNSGNRPTFVKGAKSLVAKFQKEQEKKLSDALSKLNVDWSAPDPKQTDNPTLAATMTITANGKQVSGGEVAADTDVVLSGTVTNTGTGTAYKVHARVDTDDPVFEDTELVFGKIGPGESKTFDTHLHIPPDAADRLDHLNFVFDEARSQPVAVDPIEVRVDAQARPTFAYSYQLIDEGNGDGLVQKGESQKLRVTIENEGPGVSAETTAVLRNASGDGIELDTSRFELGKMKKGDQQTVEFDFDVTKALEGDAVVEFMVWDNVLGVTANEKLHFPVDKALTLDAASGNVEVKKRAEVYDRPTEKSELLGWLKKDARVKVLGTVGVWTKVELAPGVPGFVATPKVGKTSGSANGSLEPNMQVTPPTITLDTPAYSTTGTTYKLSGKVTDVTHVEDVYIFVSNPSAKIDGRKVYYLSNRGGDNEKSLDFSADLPIWAGSNQITVIARENSDVRSVTTLYVYSEATKTATK